MNKENFEGYLVSTDLGCSSKFIDLLCQNLDLGTEAIKSNIHYSHRITHECEVCQTINFELYSYHYDEWAKIFNQRIADELKEKYGIETVSIGICYNCKKWKIDISCKKRKKVMIRYQTPRF